MKKIYFIITTILFSFSACSLDETPIDQLPEEEAYKTPELVYVNTVASLYNDIRNLATTATWDLSELPSDEAIIPTRGSDWDDGGIFRSLHNHSWTPALNFLNDSWQERYAAIGKCNQSLKIVENAKQNNPSATFYDTYIAEIKAIRALNYFYLLDQFGRVPVAITVDIPIKEVKQSKRSEVYAFIKQELDELLPFMASGYSNKQGDYYGRMTKSTVYFLLAKLAVNAQVYSDDNWEVNGSNPSGSTSFTINGTDVGAWVAVKHYCDLIKEEGYSLQQNYSSNFEVKNETSNENIFVIPQDPNLYRISNVNINNRTLHYTHGNAFGMGTWNGSCATIEMMQALGYGTDKPDPRMDLCFYTGKVTGPNGKFITAEDGNDFEYLPLAVKLQLDGSDAKKRAGARWKKYEIDRQFQGSGDFVHNDWVLFRYADVLLMKSEAELRSGNTGAALTLINEVRSRVNTTLLSSVSLDDILKERMLELSWEMWRRNDMIRFGTFTKPITDKAQSEPYRIVYPIPSDVLSSNKNLTQNPGYLK
ncbi:RagB/SusD family nutrient uptake outer membrane protein [Dysgonomonas sp. GY617]|uniref:RagB/SusD family nutrient uptake outer membrane protein n=1 Tax=Dysgonomonas sp. GY617 TaxID=2780420 RepID=UPI0018839CB8|nr:RagB/SusD family nutrient uptake outer membrane protein [Dysgonomonas sp. GY617]MBF0576036.1 RagB/SusD family nutrient uptake outer membrane protein [Dysgonomonas sp. GY617]